MRRSRARASGSELTSYIFYEQIRGAHAEHTHTHSFHFIPATHPSYIYQNTHTHTHMGMGESIDAAATAAVFSHLFRVRAVVHVAHTCECECVFA